MYWDLQPFWGQQQTIHLTQRVQKQQRCKLQLREKSLKRGDWKVADGCYSSRSEVGNGSSDKRLSKLYSSVSETRGELQKAEQSRERGHAEL